MTPQNLLINHLNPSSLLRRGWVLLLAVGCFALSAQTQAATDTPDPGPKPVSNTADGQNALLSITTGIHNTAIGFDSLLLNTAGNFNTGVGSATLLLNIGDPAAGEGIQNTAVGTAALLSNTTGSSNNAVGAFALFNNGSGGVNNAVGREALLHNVNGDQNDAFGDDAMSANVSGSFNTAMGDDALDGCIDGNSNVAVGDEAGIGIVHGSNIIAIGAGVSGVSSVFGEQDDSCYIGNIQNRVVIFSSMHPVLVDDDGKLGTTTVDANGNKVVPVVETAEHQAMLNHRLEELQATVVELRSTIVQQQKGMEVLTTQLKQQAVQIQKVSAQLELHKPAPRTAAKN